jgi:hypothetical protein
VARPQSAEWRVWLEGCFTSFPALGARVSSARGRWFNPRVRTSTLSRRISDFPLADPGSLAVPTPQCPMAFGPHGSEAALRSDGLPLGPFPATARTTIANSAIVLARLLPTVNRTASVAECANEKQVIPTASLQFVNEIAGQQTCRETYRQMAGSAKVAPMTQRPGNAGAAPASGCVQQTALCAIPRSDSRIMS